MAVDAAKRRGYEIAHLVSRRISPGDFDNFDMILAMDRANITHLRTIAPTRCKQKIELLLEYGDKYHGKDVPDPYGGDEKAFDLALDMIEDGCRGVAELVTRLAR
jgi:protein-tyrosine phosphatase